MSRYQATPKNPRLKGHVRLVYGFDRPLQCYFFSVYNDRINEREDTHGPALDRFPCDRYEMLQVMAHFEDIPDSHILAVGLDLPVPEPEPRPRHV